MQHKTLCFTFDFIMGRINYLLDRPSFVSKWGLKEFKKTYDLAFRKMRSELDGNFYAVGNKKQSTWGDLIWALEKQGFVKRLYSK